MCIILLAYQSHPAYQLIVAANRDEFYERPTAPAAFWEDAPDVLGGRDLSCGGTWLGVTREGRIAAVTNFRDPSSKKTGAPSRGALVSDFLEGRQSPAQYLGGLAPAAHLYNGFNLIAGTPDDLYYYSNRAEEDGPRKLTPGLHSVSNHLLDTMWPKVARGLQSLGDLTAKEVNAALSPDDIFNLLSDRSRAVDESLPDTGVGLELERILAPLFIVSPIYGTRSSTVLLVDKEETVTFVERTFIPDTDRREDVSYRFTIRREP